ncbi:Wzz/FepE/Etk N-terminal domain-containing protein [Bacteroides caecimuris]|uniref:Chain-length determining protein n=1 Tax=Bacteroides caecimuris TaxID=1796613 RepID=A0A4S2CF20_9BACE|nr:Wzz/FepE/Etk N-terminal domain-containing protein [Bacteroides caecimuris]TGY26988.1 chain-length determining protein [Bacteroides caecimuris]
MSTLMEQASDKETKQLHNNPHNDEMEIDLLEIVRKIIGIRKTLYKAAIVGAFIGLVIGFSIPKKYTVTVTLSPEMGSSKGNSGLAGLAASFLGSGASMGADGSDALNAALSSDIVSSTPFLLDLLNMQVPSLQKGGKEMNLSAYLDSQSSPWWSYILGMPGMVIGGIKDLLSSDEEETDQSSMNGMLVLTEEESEKILSLKENISVMMDKKTSITNVSVTLQDPKVTAVVADSVVCKLQECIVSYRTSKAKEDCAYLEKLYQDRQQEYYAAQRKYADYVDTHDNLILQSVRAEQERLQNDMSLAYQVYSQVATQLQMARAKVQEEKPVFAVVEPAVVPFLPSGMGRKMYILAFTFLSVLVTMGWLLFGKDMLCGLKYSK